MAEIAPRQKTSWKFCVSMVSGDTFCCVDYAYEGEEVILQGTAQRTPMGWTCGLKEVRFPKCNVRAIFPGEFSISQSYMDLPRLADNA